MENEYLRITEVVNAPAPFLGVTEWPWNSDPLNFWFLALMFVIILGFGVAAFVDEWLWHRGN